MKFWYQRFSLPALLLLPFSGLFRLIVAIRYFLYRKNFKKVYHFPVPIIIVGNITVGGTGKTPFVIWLANFLKKHGWKPAIISRGYGDTKHTSPYLVSDSDDPHITGDEAILLHENTKCPVMLCIDRVKGVKKLLEKTDCNIVISDDGLQHYRLGRNIEIAIVDGERQCGNGFMLPAGPLREPVTRLSKVNFIIENQTPLFRDLMPFPREAWGKVRMGGVELSYMQLLGNDAVSLQNPSQKTLLKNFQRQKVHAIAGIGNPERFFNSLRKKGLEIIPHIFPDHYQYQPLDIDFKDDLPVLMTEKDAVKCFGFAKENFWYVPVVVEIDPSFGEKFLGVLNSCEFLR